MRSLLEKRLGRFFESFKRAGKFPPALCAFVQQQSLQPQPPQLLPQPPPQLFPQPPQLPPQQQMRIMIRMIHRQLFPPQPLLQHIIETSPIKWKPFHPASIHRMRQGDLCASAQKGGKTLQHGGHFRPGRVPGGVQLLTRALDDLHAHRPLHGAFGIGRYLVPVGKAT